MYKIYYRYRKFDILENNKSKVKEVNNLIELVDFINKIHGLYSFCYIEHIEYLIK